MVQTEFENALHNHMQSERKRHTKRALIGAFVVIPAFVILGLLLWFWVLLPLTYAPPI